MQKSPRKKDRVAVRIVATSFVYYMLTGNFKIASAGQGQRDSIISLLRSAKLPTEDLALSLHNFLVALDGEDVVGAIGLERYGNDGLLRSMVVWDEFRNRGVASDLVNRLEEEAEMAGIGTLYLFTETAPLYFEKKGYERVSREDVSKSIQASSEFSSVCAESAIVMKKVIVNKNNEYV